MTERKPRIAIIVGSIREGRKGSAVGAWVKEIADERDDATYDLLELADFDIPLLTSPTIPAAADRQYGNDKVTKWSETIDGYDGFVFVTPEYNHSVPGAFKNAFDSIYPEWGNKAVGLVSYGADGGVRAVEHWRQITANAHLVAVRAQCSMSVFTDFDGEKFTPQDRRPDEVNGLLDAVFWTSNALQTAAQA